MSDDDVQDVLDVERVEFIFNSAGEPIQSGIVHYDQTDEERLAELADLPDETVISVRKSSKGSDGISSLDELSTTFPFDRNKTDYTNPTKFVRKLYEGKDSNWLAHTEAREGHDNRWMNARIGNEKLKAEKGEETAHSENPNWRWAECWRAINTWETLRTLQKDKPVAAYIAALDDKDPVTKAMWPQAIRKLLVDNEKVIVDSGKDWIGRTVQSEYKPFPKVNVVDASASKLDYYQACPIGPMCIEAAFILATQLAGINWKRLRERITPHAVEDGIYWASATLVQGKSDQHIKEMREHGSDRNLGYMSRNGKAGQKGADGSPDGGFCLAFDIDADIQTDSGKKKKNLFIFAGHVIDNHSRVYVPKTSALHELQYSKPYAPGSKSPHGPKGPANVYFYGHGHAAVLNWEKWITYIHQTIPLGGKGEMMPAYSQIGEHHLYFLPETETDFKWPRAAWLKDSPVTVALVEEEEFEEI